MTILLSALTLAAIAALFLAVAALQRHGMAGILYLLAAWLYAAGDAVRAAQSIYRETWPRNYQRAVEDAAR